MSFIAAIVTTAKASLTSKRSTSETFQPARFRALWIAPTGAIVNHSGSCAWLACATMRATGVRPAFAAALAAGENEGRGAVRDGG